MLKRVRNFLVILVGVLALLLVALGGAAAYVYFFPTAAFNLVGGVYGASAGQVHVEYPDYLSLRNFKLKQAAQVGLLEMRWDWKNKKREIDLIKIQEAKLYAGELAKLLSEQKGASAVADTDSAAEKKFPPVILNHLLLQNTEITLSPKHKVFIARAELKSGGEKEKKTARLAVNGIHGGKLGQVDEVLVYWKWSELAQRRVDSAKILNARVNVDEILRLVEAKKVSSGKKKEKGSSAKEKKKKEEEIFPPARVGHLSLENLELQLPEGRQATIDKAELKDADGEMVRLIVFQLSVGDLAKVKRVKLEWIWENLRKREVEYLDVTGANIYLDTLQAADEEKKKKKSSESASAGQGFLLKELRIRQSQLRTNIFGKRLPSFVLPIGQVSPDLVFRDLHLGGSKEDPAARLPVEAVIENYTLTSPYDGVSPMLSFGKIRVVFSWAGIQEKKIEQLQVIDPTIYVGNDLFWFAEDIRKGKRTAGADEPEEKKNKIDVPKKDVWRIGMFSVAGGRLELINYGHESVQLPFRFNVEPHFNLIVGDLTQLQLKTNFEIPPTTLDYPDYGPLRLVNLRGKMEFSLPVSTANNIVNTLQMEAVEWKRLRASEGQLWVTYDAKGIYGGFYARAYGGDIGGDFTFYWDRELSWVGSCYTKAVNLEPVTQMMYPEHFVMSGPVDSRFVVRGAQREIRGMGGEVNLNQSGRMQVVAIDDLLERMPAEWAPFKRNLVEAGLRAFRDYDYHRGKCEFAYAPPESFLKLNLNGVQGARNFDVRWHDKARMLSAIEIKQ